MSLIPDDFHRMVISSPMERLMERVFSDALRDYERSMRSVAPYWLDQPALQECNVGNAVGKVVNDPNKFAVEVNVTQFRPQELSVNVKENNLVIEGHHEERSDESGRIERHFIRKYLIPEDVNPDTIESHLSDKGVLSVFAKKFAIAGANARTIPIQAAPRGKQQASVEPAKEEPKKAD